MKCAIRQSPWWEVQQATTENGQLTRERRTYGNKHNAMVLDDDWDEILSLWQQICGFYTADILRGPLTFADTFFDLHRN